MDDDDDDLVSIVFLQMVKMMITVVIIYALCWLPLHTITLVGDRHESIWQVEYIQVKHSLHLMVHYQKLTENAP